MGAGSFFTSVMVLEWCIRSGEGDGSRVPIRFVPVGLMTGREGQGASETNKFNYRQSSPTTYSTTSNGRVVTTVFCPVGVEYQVFLSLHTKDSPTFPRERGFT